MKIKAFSDPRFSGHAVAWTNRTVPVIPEHIHVSLHEATVSITVLSHPSLFTSEHQSELISYLVLHCSLLPLRPRSLNNVSIKI